MNDAEQPAAGHPQPHSIPNLTACDREPIHMPGSIQPHGLLLVAEPETLKVIAAAGDVEGRLASDWLGRGLDDLLASDAAELRAAASGKVEIQPIAGKEAFDVSLHSTPLGIVAELEPASPLRPTAAQMLAQLDAAAAQLERAPDLPSLWEAAAKVFRRLIGFDRVMIYQFLDDDTGVVVGEDRAADIGSFLHHHFPASDIPKQARALYIRNRVRVIPDVDYVPAPLRPASKELAELDMSDVELRSVSPIHLQYLRNMGIRASASVSIVTDGRLWGLVACHNNTPLGLSREQRLACQILVADLARQLRAQDEANLYRERIRLRSAEEAALSGFGGEGSLEQWFDKNGEDLRRSLNADGFAVANGPVMLKVGNCPGEAELPALERWAAARAELRSLATSALPSLYPAAQDFASPTGGLLAVTIPGDEPLSLLWFRAERIEVVNWAGNPHKASSADPNALLTPRASFAAWSETVRGQSRPWSIAETETASRIARAMLEQRQNRRIRELNARLSATIVENERLLSHKDFLMSEVNHRVQNSLQLVASFLRLQARAAGEEPANIQLAEAERRVGAVALVHRQLYGGDTIENVDLSRYLSELCGEIANSMGGEWRQSLQLDLAPIQTPANRAVQLGLILTELLVNAAKYAYAGNAGPIGVTLDQHRNQLRLAVSDRGAGRTGNRQGFGTMMLNAMVGNLGGTIEYEDRKPGLRSLITAPVSA